MPPDTKTTRSPRRAAAAPPGNSGIHRQEREPWLQLQALDRELPVHLRDNDVPVSGLFGPVNHHDVAVIKTKAFHAAAARPHKIVEARRRMQSSLRSSSFYTQSAAGEGKPAAQGSA